MAIAQQTQLINDNLAELNADELQSIQGGVDTSQLGEAVTQLVKEVTDIPPEVIDVVEAVPPVLTAVVGTVADALSGIKLS